jgi:hypothetical protein
MGIYVLLFVGTTPIGSYLCGQLAEHVGDGRATGVRATILITAGLCALGVMAGLVYARRTAAAAPDAALPEPDLPVQARERVPASTVGLEKEPGTA